MKTLHFKLCLILLITSSCYPLIDHHLRTTEYHYISNQTNKDIVHQLIINDPSISEDTAIIRINGFCKDSLEWVFSCVKGTAGRPEPIYYEDFQIFNLSDTMSLNWEFYSSDYFKPSGSLSLFFNAHNIDGFFDRKAEESNAIVEYHLLFNDSLISFMQKDYSMLEKFKDYYSK